ncbi:hypothetical protein AB0C28_08335 [Nonomuraea sp. NPDC048892]|uniref:beta-galactosidase trimerization domain-containing protein n=1 Tax=Nonomuraea sp. NPDC048892 TaxID=3154624 RepID=UPI0033F93E96
MNVFDAFREPPRAFSPAAIWWWSGEPLRRDRLRWQLERLVAGGVHNLVILNLAPSGPMFGSRADDPLFLSEEWWELLDGVCQDAHDLGAFLWFYDQLGFSGADLQARLVQEHPDFAGQWLGPGGTVTTRGFDYLSREACAVLLDRVHGEFERRVGHWFGRVIAGSFQDELPTLPTWSDRFAAEHLARRGRPFDALAPSPDWRSYQTTRAELAEEAFFRPLAEWHERHGLVHGCDQQDPARAGHPVEGVRLYADYARTHRWFGAPGSDHHGDARLHSSLAHLYGRPRTWIEAFHSSGWGGTLEETFDWLLPWLRAGATLYNPHAVYYTTRRGWWEWAPPATDWRQPYWRHHRVFAEAVTRLCAALSLGRHACDVAVLLPTSTAQTGTDAGTAGPGTVGLQAVGHEEVGPEAVGHEAAGPEAVGPGEADLEAVGPEEVSPTTVGPGAAGSGASGPEPDRPEPGGPGAASATAHAAHAAQAAQAAHGTHAAHAAHAARAQEVYRELVGDMAWFATKPGVLDRLGLDADVIDEDSVRRAVVKDGRLTVSTEAYRAVILPAVTVLDEDVAARLADFSAGGGLLVAVGAPSGFSSGGTDASHLPPKGTDPSHLAARLGARFVRSADRLGEALTDLERRVEAPVPALVREDGETTLVFLPAAFPMASRIGVGRPEERGVDLGWLDAVIDFDPARYAREMPVTIHGVQGAPLLLRPFAGGDPVALPYMRDGDTVRVTVPFDDGPAALLVFDGTRPEPASRPAYTVVAELGDAEWDVELVPTLDDTWSDFGGGGAGIEAWTLRTPDGEPVDVTFGPHGEQRVDGGPWTPSIWSSSRGLHKDPVHRETLGPKGRVPVEFLTFGRTGGGVEAAFRTLVTVPDTCADICADTVPDTYSAASAAPAAPADSSDVPAPAPALAFGAAVSGSGGRDLRTTTQDDRSGGGAWVAIGAGAAKTLRIDGEEWPLDDRGYAAVTRAPVPPGEHLLELVLVPDEELDLRAYVCLLADPADAARPEWIAGTPLETVVIAAPEQDGGGVLQVAATSFCRVLVNGTEAGRQGGFDPYAEADIPRVRRYDVSDLLRPGANTVRVESDGWVLVDGLAVSGPHWTPEPRVRRRQYGDPAALWLLPRPHPLPGATWLDDTTPAAPPAALPVTGPTALPAAPAALPAVFSVPGARPRTERFLLDAPPGATGVEVNALGPVELRASLGGPGPGEVELVVRTTPGASGGAAFTGPVRFTCGPGRMRLGDWEELGLAGYSGGVRYRTTITARSGPGVLDLGRVRGTAEVTVNGRPCGVRVCSPYRFDVDLDDGGNVVEILVLGTLAAYLDEVSPTHFVFPGQRTTGLFGPVRLHRPATDLG